MNAFLDKHGFVIQLISVGVVVACLIATIVQIKQ